MRCCRQARANEARARFATWIYARNSDHPPTTHSAQCSAAMSVDRLICFAELFVLFDYRINVQNVFSFSFGIQRNETMRVGVCVSVSCGWYAFCCCGVLSYVLS